MLNLFAPFEPLKKLAGNYRVALTSISTTIRALKVRIGLGGGEVLNHANSMRLLTAAGFLVATAFLVRLFVPPSVGNGLGLTFYTPEVTRYVPFRVLAFWLLITAASVTLLFAGLRFVKFR